MTGPLRRFDPFRPIDMLSSLWSTAAVGPVSSGAAMAYRTLFTTVRRLVVGRRLAIRLDDGELTLTVTEFDSRLDVRALAVGQLNDVRIAARDICWQGNEFEHATAVLHNVHMRPTMPPVLVAAPVDLTLEVPTTALHDLFRWAAPRLSGEVGSDGVARLRMARRPLLGHLEVDARLDGSTLWLRPRVAVVRTSRWTLPARTPAYPVRLPELPHGLRLTGIAFAPDAVHLSASVAEWQMDMPRSRVEDIIGQLSVAGVPLNLTRLTRLL
ncbi:hypothetical protein BST36_09415 [Mycolicibacterium moriokaense]|uniref:DUF2993 domain-containing protein n=1 Tax=Mycolicibacterium moriokaense TaxID=39691 RepID=A0AAD1HCV0_9MYCO|nr:hypothetical protein [Mycolicibacterium moriokaense]MCV7038557.1 hypothetical protein [Mycolicibacterium moriokaense]ORB24789.1 hypothetical protein BST36_09415 [Mycolicibacterium moriokaense]BBX02319.1 hypothetical protein MMOR_32550 [Mycolicibacterium moriokaense]